MYPLAAVLLYTILVGGLQGNAPPVPKADNGGIMRLPFSAGFKIVQHLALNVIKRNALGGQLAQTKENGQAFEKTQAVFFQANAVLQLQNKFLVKRVILTNAGVKIRAVFQKVLQPLSKKFLRRAG